MGRALFDSKFCAVWRALFELFVPFERGLAPVFWYLIRGRAAVLQGTAPLDQGGVSAMGVEVASSSAQSGATPAELGALLRLYVDGIPPSI